MMRQWQNSLGLSVVLHTAVLAGLPLVSGRWTGSVESGAPGRAEFVMVRLADDPSVGARPVTANASAPANALVPVRNSAFAADSESPPATPERPPVEASVEPAAKPPAAPPAALVTKPDAVSTGPAEILLHRPTPSAAKRIAVSSEAGGISQARSSVSPTTAAGSPSGVEQQNSNGGELGLLAARRPLSSEGNGSRSRAIPRYLENPPPAYPAAARRRSEEGTVIVSAWVSARGLVERVTIKEGSGSEALDRAALRAVHDWKFDPARQGASAVASWVEVPVTFRLTR